MLAVPVDEMPFQCDRDVCVPQDQPFQLIAQHEYIGPVAAEEGAWGKLSGPGLGLSDAFTILVLEKYLRDYDRPVLPALIPNLESECVRCHPTGIVNHKWNT